MKSTERQSSTPLHPEVQWNLRSRLPAMVFALSIVGIGGFLGGLLTSYGPPYINVHITEAFPAEMSTEAVAVVPGPPHLIATAGSQEPAGPKEPLPTGADAQLVMHDKGATYLVLSSTAQRQWGTGKMRVRGNEFSFSLRQKVAQEADVGRVRAWQGRELSLYGAKGYTCSASVGDLYLLQNSFEDGDDADSVIREFLDGTFHLVAELKPLRGRCKPAIWARDASLPTPALGTIVRPSKSLRRRALDEYRQHSAWQERQREFAKEGFKGKWDRIFDSSPSIRSIRSADEELVLVSASVGGCGDFEGTLSLLFRVEPDGSLLVLDSEEVFVSMPTAAADFDGDGDLDLVGAGLHSDTLLVKQHGSLTVESRTQVLVNVCGC